MCIWGGWFKITCIKRNVNVNEQTSVKGVKSSNNTKKKKEKENVRQSISWKERICKYEKKDETSCNF